jgi:hypothetical protein
VNQSPEARLLTRYAMTVVLGVLALVTRIVYAAPERFANGNATPRLRAVWYVFLAEVVVAATAFARGKPVLRAARTLAVAAPAQEVDAGANTHGVHD